MQIHLSNKDGDDNDYNDDDIFYLRGTSQDFILFSDSICVKTKPLRSLSKDIYDVIVVSFLNINFF